MSDEPASKIEITPEMIEAGATVLEDFTAEEGGLTNMSTYVARAVYLAMERRKRETEADHS